uniref:Uncharacterized protein n=1 Tax=Anguilla anguilla TaxID=7936 RepID=A0A0E9X869_ANGAN
MALNNKPIDLALRISLKKTNKKTYTSSLGNLLSMWHNQSNI